MSKPIYFDIESTPLPLEELKKIAPEFDPAEVKMGNIKDEVKILAKLVVAQQEQWEDFVEKAALRACSGRVAMIGLLDGGDFTPMIADDDQGESAILTLFWGVVETHLGSNTGMVGFNIHEFDLPFLVRRSWKLGVQPPSIIRTGRYWNEAFVDVRQKWLMGEKSPPKGTSSLEGLAKFFGLEPKKGNGKDFYKMSREEQLAYLEHDLRLTQAIWGRMI